MSIDDIVASDKVTRMHVLTTSRSKLLIFIFSVHEMLATFTPLNGYLLGQHYSTYIALDRGQPIKYRDNGHVILKGTTISVIINEGTRSGQSRL